MNQIKMTTNDGQTFDLFKADGTLTHMRFINHNHRGVPPYRVEVPAATNAAPSLYLTNGFMGDCAKRDYLLLVNSLHEHYTQFLGCVREPAINEVELLDAMRATWLPMTVANNYSVYARSTYTATRCLRVPQGRIMSPESISMPTTDYLLVPYANDNNYAIEDDDTALRARYMDDIVSPTDEIVAGRVQEFMHRQAAMADTAVEKKITYSVLGAQKADDVNH